MHEGLAGVAQASQLEDPPDTRALLRLGRALIEQYCASFRQIPKRIAEARRGCPLAL